MVSRVAGHGFVPSREKGSTSREKGGPLAGRFDAGVRCDLLETLNPDAGGPDEDDPVPASNAVTLLRELSSSMAVVSWRKG